MLFYTARNLWTLQGAKMSINEVHNFFFLLISSFTQLLKYYWNDYDYCQYFEWSNLLKGSIKTKWIAIYQNNKIRTISLWEIDRKIISLTWASRNKAGHLFNVSSYRVNECLLCLKYAIVQDTFVYAELWKKKKHW